MSLNNRSGDMAPFDMSRRPVKQNILLMPLIWLLCHIMTRKMGLKRVERRGMDGVHPPFLVIAAHQGFSDYYIAPRALFPYRANYVSDMEGFAAFGNELYRQIGCIGKRRYTPDISVIRNISYALEKLGQPVVIFPESRHCDAGITSTLPDNLGKMVKHFGVPVVILTANGSYLANPFWDEERTRKTKLRASLGLLLDEKQVKEMSAEDISRMIYDRLQYDEYEYQLENGIMITDRPARGLHLPLYKCRSCGCEGRMVSDGNILECSACGEKWEMCGDGQLFHSNRYIRIPDWYRWEREQAEMGTEAGYSITFRVRIDALPNEKGFVSLGSGYLTHTAEGFELGLDDAPSGAYDSFPLRISSRALECLQTEYNYRGRGKCIVLSTKNCCYYCYSDEPSFIVTKLGFITEYLHRQQKKEQIR